MKKLNKKVNLEEMTLEAYATCYDSCYAGCVNYDGYTYQLGIYYRDVDLNLQYNRIHY